VDLRAFAAPKRLRPRRQDEPARTAFEQAPIARRQTRAPGWASANRAVSSRLALVADRLLAPRVHSGAVTRAPEACAGLISAASRWAGSGISSSGACLSRRPRL